jgi:TetR/AcrR family transcriptional regulator, transcriptional repressor for nem operon
VRYPPDQKAKAKQAILQAGAKALRANGFNGIGVDGVAAAAGVTSGAFYSNFPSKTALLEEVITACLGEPFIGSITDREKLREWLTMYFSAYHRDNPTTGCVMPTLSADVAREGPEVKDAYGRKMQQLISQMSKVLDGAEPAREQRAWSIVAIMVGALTISRALPDGPQAQRALESALATAVRLIAPMD